MVTEAASDERARAIWSEGRARFPQLSLPVESLAEHLRQLGNHGTDADLYLACACALGVSAAHEVLERHVLSEVPGFIARIDSSPQTADEVRQQLRERLLVRRGERPPRIAEYSGLGPLGAWVRVAALRLALDRAGGPPQVELDATPELATPNGPELAVIRERYQDAFQAALRDAFSALTTKERALLRLSVVEGFSIDRLGQIYNVHRATAARWLTAARERVLEECYRLLGERLELPTADLRSLAPLLRSQLHLSLSRLL